MEKRNPLLRWIEIPVLLLAICAAGTASATTAGLEETRGATAQLAAALPGDRANAAAFDGLTAGNAIQAGALQGQTADAPRTNVRVMWFAGFALVLYLLYRKQRSLGQQPVA